ncbi:hypothetical protein Tco_0978530 [Tanacetum coccineum]|uniref:Uncharacterized protein n=1 Tax=Tanacetum coccineum TaxID=301880 RepID=A0ABQ5ENM8_9ASTR
MTYPRFTKLIVKYVISKNDKIPKRRLSFQHVIKLDTTLGNLKFANKGTIDPVFGMPIPVVMLNNDIKASAEYSEYLKKAVGGSTPAVKGGKGLLSKKGVKTVTEEVYESEQMDDLGDSEETEEEEVVSLVRQRSNGVVIGKLKGLEILTAATQLKLDMKKAQKASKDDFYIQQRSKGSGEGSGITPAVPSDLVHKSSNEGAGVIPEVPYESNSSSSSSSSDSEVAVEDISSDEDEATKKANNAKTADAEKDTEDQVAIEQVAERQAEGEEHSTDQGGNEPASNAQAGVQTAERQPQEPEATLISSSQTLSSTKFTNRFINEHAKVNLSDILKDLVEPEKQLTNPLRLVSNRLISLKTYLISEKSSRRRLPSKACQSIHQLNFNKAALAMYDQKDKLYIMMEKFKAYDRHPTHKALFNALAVSLSVDEDDMDKLEDPTILKKHRRDDHDKDPSTDLDRLQKEEKEGS